jgi:hypothetical protein
MYYLEDSCRDYNPFGLKLHPQMYYRVLEWLLDALLDN